MVAVGPIVINCPDVPDVVLPMLIFPVWDSKNLNAVDGVSVEVCEVYNVFIVSPPCAIEYVKKIFFAVASVK